MKFISLLVFVMLLSGCASLKERREAALLDRLYHEGQLSDAEYWKNKTELLNKNSKNVKYRYNIAR